MNSANVAGGSPEAAHFRDEPQRPVRQVPLPFESKLQPVRPQIRPDQLIGAVKSLDSPGFKANPPPPKLLPGVIAGQIVTRQSLINVKMRAESDDITPAYQNFKN